MSIAPGRLQKIKGLWFLEFRCAVEEMEDGALVRCNVRHLEPVANRIEAEDIADAGFLCEECQRKGYAWFSRLTGNIDPTEQLQRELVTDPLGARNTEFRTGGTRLVSGDVTRVQGASLNDAQLKKGQENTANIKGYGAVKVYPEYNDVLMLRLDEAKNPGDPTVERKNRTQIGMAPQPQKEKNPFDEMFD